MQLGQCVTFLLQSDLLTLFRCSIGIFQDLSLLWWKVALFDTDFEFNRSVWELFSSRFFVAQQFLCLFFAHYFYILHPSNCWWLSLTVHFRKCVGSFLVYITDNLLWMGLGYKVIGWNVALSYLSISELKKRWFVDLQKLSKWKLL